MTNKAEVVKYGWWGQSNAPPTHLKTKKQLAEIGLKPKNPVGVIHTQKYDLYLYDPQNPDSTAPKRKASEAQLKALAKGRETQRRKAYRHSWYRNRGRHIKEENRAIEWARKVLVDKEKWVILDTETTGLDCAEIVQIGIVDLDGKTVLNSLVKPTISIPADVTNIHGIDDAAVKDAPTFPEIYPKIVSSLEGKKVLIYNADFDIDILGYCRRLHELEPLGLRKRSDCLMEWYAQFCGDWHEYYQSYRWQPLGGDHSAVGDCLAALAVLRDMAEAEIVDVDTAFAEAWTRYKARMNST